jgi:hypothetical protein
MCLSDIQLLFSIKACYSESLNTCAEGNILFPQCHQKEDPLKHLRAESHFRGVGERHKREAVESGMSVDLRTRGDGACKWFEVQESQNVRSCGDVRDR